ncbi:30S ribosomal protein S6 alpha, chloroplastic [Triticum urartu]|uniref:30S ribosomal protein S6 alpha, chloroplastic n=1 Tax=Triticum urartu TaxID=4572 RepID=A0A8R7UA30_TRIUA|nr:30S ribosomal protein S6 alpha, chloroplastic [Triticum urartu]
MPPPMALSVSSSAAAFAPRHRLPAPRSLTRAARAFSTGYAASFYGGAASATRTRGRDEEEVGDEDGSSSGFGGMSASEAAMALEEREMPPCPPGLRQYETMVVLRPDMSEEERLALIQRYEELLVAGGAMYVEVFNRGVIPLAYSIRKRNSRTGLPFTYYDGIYLLWTYFTKPESVDTLQMKLNADDDVIRSTSFKVRKRRVY